MFLFLRSKDNKIMNSFKIYSFIVLFHCMTCMGSVYYNINNFSPIIQQVSSRITTYSKDIVRKQAFQKRYLASAIRPASWINLIDWRIGLAGGLAGGLSNALLLPIDTLKTMRQTDKELKSIRQAFMKLHKIGITKLYSGFIPACLGSMPSSALYFGSYETAKNILYKYESQLKLPKPVIHMLSAMSGNIVSSIIFVPKDVIKQQLQVYQTNSNSWLKINKYQPASVVRVMKHIFAIDGLKGFYPSYRATLLRNIPGAVVNIIDHR